MIRKNTILEIGGESYFVLETHGEVTAKTLNGRVDQVTPPEEIVLRKVEKIKR